MIFVTVGEQLPFDRLIKTMDRWVGETGFKEVFAQIGNASYVPNNMKFCKFCPVKDYRDLIAGADLIIGHVGWKRFFIILLN